VAAVPKPGLEVWQRCRSHYVAGVPNFYTIGTRVPEPGRVVGQRSRSQSETDVPDFYNEIRTMK
jgi:hypothetical protein